MTNLFNTGIKTILLSAGLFFIIFSYVCLLWTARSTKELRNIAAAVVVSLLHTFKIVLTAVILLGLVHLIVARFFS